MIADEINKDDGIRRFSTLKETVDEFNKSAPVGHAFAVFKRHAEEAPIDFVITVPTRVRFDQMTENYIFERVA